VFACPYLRSEALSWDSRQHCSSTVTVGELEERLVPSHIVRELAGRYAVFPDIVQGDKAWRRCIYLNML
jgi:hypothetical protein